MRISANIYTTDHIWFYYSGAEILVSWLCSVRPRVKNLEFYDKVIITSDFLKAKQLHKGPASEHKHTTSIHSTTALHTKTCIFILLFAIEQMLLLRLPHLFLKTLSNSVGCCLMYSGLFVVLLVCMFLPPEDGKQSPVCFLILILMEFRKIWGWSCILSTECGNSRVSKMKYSFIFDMLNTPLIS